MLRLSVEPEAEAEIEAAASWYQDRSPALRMRFIGAVRDATRRIVENPEMYQTIRRQYRAASLDVFPYRLLYRLTHDEIVVVGCLHNRRNPQVTSDRIGK